MPNLRLRRQSVARNDDGTASITEEYIVDDTIALTYATVLAQAPALGAAKTVDGIDTYLQSISADAIEDSQNQAWTLTLSYTSEATNDAEYIALDMNSSAVAVDVFRAGATPPGNFDTPGNSDIAGTPVDQGGQPVTALIPTQELTITNFRSDNNAAAIRLALGKRNSTTWLGAGIGYVLFTGASAKRVGPTKYEVQYKFVYDDFAHLRQVAIRDLDGRPKISTPQSDGRANASLVVWRQPFPGTYNFGSMGIVV